MDHANVRPPQETSVNPLVEAEKIAEATKQALKRKIAQAAASDVQSRSLPAKLIIDPNDPEDVVCEMSILELMIGKMIFDNKLGIPPCFLLYFASYVDRISYIWLGSSMLKVILIFLQEISSAPFADWLRY